MTGSTDFPSWSQPQWPGGLSDQTPLPFALWRVMDAVDGQRSAEQVAAVLGLNTAQVQRALALVGAQVSRAEHQERPASTETLQALAQALIAVVGPMGRLLLDDARDEAGETASVPTLVRFINTQLDEAHRGPFLGQLQRRGVA